MSTFESSIRQIAYPQQLVYNTLSNLDNINKVKNKVPADKLQGLSFTNDSITMSSPMGDVTMQIVNREPIKTIKFETVKSPVPFNFWIQLLPVTGSSCKMKLTVKAELNPFIKGMVEKPLRQAIEKIADVLESIHYEE